MTKCRCSICTARRLVEEAVQVEGGNALGILQAAIQRAAFLKMRADKTISSFHFEAVRFQHDDGTIKPPILRLGPPMRGRRAGVDG